MESATPHQIRRSARSSCATAGSSAKATIIVPATPHAETNALEQAGSNARGATVYVSLEPCRARRTHAALHESSHRSRRRARRRRERSIQRNTAAARPSCAKRGIEVAVAEDPAARDLIEIFARTSAAIVRTLH